MKPTENLTKKFATKFEEIQIIHLRQRKKNAYMQGRQDDYEKKNAKMNSIKLDIELHTMQIQLEPNPVCSYY